MAMAWCSLPLVTTARLGRNNDNIPARSERPRPAALGYVLTTCNLPLTEGPTGVQINNRVQHRVTVKTWAPSAKSQEPNYVNAIELSGIHLP
ncbi:hypothetical protein VTJ04DRAFT_9543 [Mycothermus thermophilus]|uniref:uncharacterized protein n=1 Tax=Humicola insolens TaxID=85995 RepID=UPI0037445671